MLTVTKLRKMPFGMHMHLNRGREHDLIHVNHQFKLYVATTSARPKYEILRKTLYHTTPAGERIEADMLAPDGAEQLAKFCAAYNAANKATTP